MGYRRVRFTIALDASNPQSQRIPCIFDASDTDMPPISALCAWPKPDGKGTGRYPFFVVAMCTDETGRGWLAGRFFWDLFSVQSIVDEEDLPKSFNAKHERIEDSEISFVPLVAVVGWCLVARCTMGAYRRFLDKPRAKAASHVYLCRLRLARRQALTSELDRHTGSRGGLRSDGLSSRPSTRDSITRARTPSVIPQI